MNQSTHAWLAVEAYRKIVAVSKTPEGKKKKLDKLASLLGANLRDVVVAAWLPDALIRDMMYGHVFKNSLYKGDQAARFTLTAEDLKKKYLVSGAQTPKVAFKLVPASWWQRPYRVKQNGGHLPARVIALCQTARDMFRMGDADVTKLTGLKSKGSEIIAQSLLFSPRDIAITMWMVSHYIADAHMPFHCDNRALASTSKQKTHGAVEEIWGKQVAALFHSSTILKQDAQKILDAQPPKGSRFAGIDFGTAIRPLKNSGDPWKEAVYICRASFAVSFAFVPPSQADVDSQKAVRLADILTKGFCGEDLFWALSRAIMADAASAIAMFWQDIWVDLYSSEKK